MATNDEFERNMSFIVEQQAQFASDIQQLRESQTETNQVVARLAYATLEGFKDVNAKIDALVDGQMRTDDQLSRMNEQLVRTNEQLSQTNEQLSQTNEQLSQTNEHLRQTDEQVRRTDESVRRTDQNLSRTDESLRALIGVVTRHLSGENAGGGSN